jgi:hypothetical protein
VEKITWAFPKLLAQLETSPEAVEALVFEAWRRSVGDALNEQTAPAEFLGTTLKVAVVSETLRRHLADMAGEILISLNAKLTGWHVTFLNFVVDAVSVSDSRPAKAADAEPEIRLSEEAVSEINASAAVIGDETLRKKFVAAAESCLERAERNLDRS